MASLHLLGHTEQVREWTSSLFDERHSEWNYHGDVFHIRYA